jgi:hypothetical protein
MKRLTETAVRIWASLPPGLARTLAHTLSFSIGLLLAVSIHYLLYRLGLPSKPFIYVSF